MSHSGCALVWHVQPRVVIFPCRTHYRPSSVKCLAHYKVSANDVMGIAVSVANGIFEQQWQLTSDEFRSWKLSSKSVVVILRDRTDCTEQSSKTQTIGRSLKFFGGDTSIDETELQYAPITNLGAEGKFAKLDNSIAITGGTTSVKCHKQKNIISTNRLLVDPSFQRLSEEDKMREWK